MVQIVHICTNLLVYSWSGEYIHDQVHNIVEVLQEKKVEHVILHYEEEWKVGRMCDKSVCIQDSQAEQAHTHTALHKLVGVYFMEGNAQCSHSRTSCCFARGYYFLLRK